MFVPTDHALVLTDDQRRAIWLMDASGRVLPTAAIYRLWYTPPVSESCLPAAIGRGDWWPEDGLEFESVIPIGAQAWIDLNWATMSEDFTVLAELCLHYRAKRERVADVLTTFWGQRLEAARVLFIERHAQPAQLHAWRSGDLHLDESAFPLLNEDDAWIDHVEWLLTGGIRAHAPRRDANGAGGAAAPPADTEAPTP